MDLFPGTKIKSQFLFFGNGDGTSFTFKTNELSPRYREPVIIKELKVNTAENFKNAADFTTESYRVTVESVKRNADNVQVVLVFESITDRTISLAWGSRNYSDFWDVPYLTDENGDKYVLRRRKNPADESFLKDLGVDDTDFLPGTRLKADLKIYGTGSGSIFTLASKERSPKYDRPIVIRNLKPDSRTPGRTAAVETIGSAPSVTDSDQPPTFVTESYRVVVSEAQRTGDNILITLVFENLLDATIRIAWGRGENTNGNENSWRGAEPYLIDENADRYYLRYRDDGKITDCLWCDSAQLLPGTKLKSRFIFKVTGTGTTFTFASNEFEPKPDRPVVIKGIKLK